MMKQDIVVALNACYDVILLANLSTDRFVPAVISQNKVLFGNLPMGRAVVVNACYDDFVFITGQPDARVTCLSSHMHHQHLASLQP